jgi:GntR family transcriptional regulator, arabinose operon transcriptional repressor
MGIDFNKPVALYEQIENDIRAKIISGELKIGDKIGSQSELSKKYNVSLITVKRAVSNLINEGILFGRIGKGTYVARKTSSINHSIHKTIGLVLRDLRHPFFSLVVQSVEERAYQMGYNVLLSNSSGKIEKEEAQITHFENIGVDGLVIASMNLKYRASDKIKQLHENGFPYIMVSYMDDHDIYFVGTDNEKGAYLATEHLIKLGYENIGYINVEKNNLLGTVRKKGYEEALINYGREVSQDLVHNLESGMDRFEAAYKLGLRYNEFKLKPDALFFYSDVVALGFQKGITELGLRVPDDLAIVGYDDIYGAKLASSPLTTIRQASEKIGEIAVDSIIKRIEGKNVPLRVILEPRLIIRSSCGFDIKQKYSKNLKHKSVYT